ncbi:MAG: S9 family peptidase [Gemmatimonadota bacterium]
MRRLARLTVVFLMVVSARGAAQRPMTPDDVLSMRQVGDPQLSPDGKWIAYVVSAVDLADDAVNSDVWIVPTAGGTPVRLTTSKKADNQPRWSPDGKWIAFVSGRDEKPQIFLIRPNGGEAEKLTESKTGVQSFQWSPDGTRLAYVAVREPTPDEEKREKEKDDAIVVDRDFKLTRLWLMDLATRKATEVVKGDFQLSDPRWSPDGSRIAYVTTPSPKADDGSLSDIFVYDVGSGGSRKLVENPGPDNGPRWSPDGRDIVYLSREGKLRSIEQLKLMRIAAAGGTPRPLAPGFLYQPQPVTFSPDGKTVYFTAGVRTTSQLFSMPAEGGEPRQVSSGSGAMSAASFAADGKVVAFTKSDVEHPTDVYAVRDLASFVPQKLTDHNPDLGKLALGKGEVVKWKSKDGMEIEGVLLYPVGYQPGKRYPTIAFIHGGPSGAWTEAFPGSWGNYGHVYAGKGWVSFYPNVRGSSNYGEKFLLANLKDWGGGDYQDIQTGLDELVRRGIADSTKLAQSGWSYGGYMTAWTLTQTNRFKAVMVGAGLTNMYSMYSTNDLQTTLENYFGGEPWNDEQAYRRASAMVFIKQAKTPTLIMHGQQDTRVPIGQAQELYMGLKKNNVPVTLVFYPREGHGLGEPRHQLDKMKREYGFFAKQVLGVEEEQPALVP